MHGAADSRATNAYVGAGGSNANAVPGFREGQPTERSNGPVPSDRALQVRQHARPGDSAGRPAVCHQRHRSRESAPLVSEGNIEGGFIAQNWGNLGDLPMLRASSDVGPKKRNQWLLRYLSTICLSSRDLLAPLAARIPHPQDGSILHLRLGY